MPDENARFCPSCGKPLKEGASFCTVCGAATSAAGEATGVPPPAAVTAPPQQAETAAIPPQGTPLVDAEVQQPQAPGEPLASAPKRGKAPLIIGIFGALLVTGGIVVLVLFLTVWKGGGGAAGGTDSPQALAEKYMSSLEKKNINAYMDCFEPDYFSIEDNPILEGLNIDIKQMLEASFQAMEVKFNGVKLEVESEKGNSATVVTTAGTMSVKVSMMGLEQEADLADEPLEFDMIRKGGRWYLTEDPMPSMLGTDYNYEEMNLDQNDTQDLFPENLDSEDLKNLLPEDMSLKDLEEMLPEGMSLKDLENLSPEDMEKLMQELEQWMQDGGVQQEGRTSV